MTLPFTLRQEPYGTVIGAGPDAPEAPLARTGYGICARCLQGRDNWCATPRFIGVHRPGGYADHLLVPHPRYLVDTTGVDPAYATVLACSGLSSYSVINRPKPFAAADWIVIIGAGGLGLMAAAMLRALGHERIVACDIDAAKLGPARNAGAVEVMNPAAPETPTRLQALPRGVVGVVDLVGAVQTAQLGLAALRKGGRCIVVGLFGGEIPLLLVTMAQRAISLQGFYVGNIAELRQVVALARSGKLKPIPTQTRPMQQISLTLDQLKASTVIGRVVTKIH